MFDAAECLFLYVESSLRVGSERGRPRGRPSGATGGGDRLSGDPGQQLERGPASPWPVAAGPDRAAGPARLPADSEEPQPQPSSVVVSDAIPLLFPVRSLAGVFAWVTSLEILARFQRDVAGYGVKIAPMPQLPALAPETAGVAPESPLLCSKQTLVLEELSFPVQAAEEVRALGAWLAEHAFPDDPVFEFWRRGPRAGSWCCPRGRIVTS